MEAHRLYLQDEILYYNHQHDPPNGYELDDDQPSQGSPIEFHPLS
jgi:hypothetical protein